MKKRSRIENSLKNISFSFVNQFLTLILSFVVRTVFIKVLGIELLGINGLFGNILIMLSLADLGITSAISYSLYNPLLKNDENKIRVLIKYFSKIYTGISVAVLILGISLLPFLQYLIKGVTDIENIKFIYLIFVVNISSGYLYAYKRTLIVSDQKGYIITQISSFFNIILSLSQIIILVVYSNYILYLISAVLFNILQNIYVSYKCNQLYPYIKKTTTDKITKEDLNLISKNIFALFIYKIGDVITNGTDNIVISAFLGLKWVGLYSNYILICNAVNGILYNAFDSITASIGNLVAENDEDKKYKIFNLVNFLNFWLYGISSICILVLINDFIKIWIGQEYLLGSMFLCVLVANFYVTGRQNTSTIFRSSYGLFWKGKFMPIIMISLNLSISLILVNLIGLPGVFLGTIISRLATNTWYDPYILHKYCFNYSIIKYTKKNIIYTLKLIIVVIIVINIATFIPAYNILFWIIKSIIIFIISNCIFLLIFFRTNEFKYLLNIIKTMIRKVF